MIRFLLAIALILIGLFYFENLFVPRGWDGFFGFIFLGMIFIAGGIALVWFSPILRRWRLRR